MNDSKIMKDIREIRANNYLSEVGLSMQEIINKRQKETWEIEKIIKEYGLRLYTD
jgi:transcriptional regulator of NAD metabolism